MDVLKVSAKSSPNSVAGALAGVLREKGSAELQAIGAGALNQAVKAVAIARGFVAPSGVDLVCIPAFTDIIIDGEERTAIKLIVSRVITWIEVRSGYQSVGCLFSRLIKAIICLFSTKEHPPRQARGFLLFIGSRT